MTQRYRHQTEKEGRFKMTWDGNWSKEQRQGILTDDKLGNDDVEINEVNHMF